MKRIRIYVDTSVIGGCLDDEFAVESLALLQAARDGLFNAVNLREGHSPVEIRSPREVV